MFVPHQIGDFWSEIYLLLLNTVRVKIGTNKLFSEMGTTRLHVIHPLVMHCVSLDMEKCLFV